ncbi:MAG: guanylate kinase [Ruminococcus sp.]|nr:guanylate kinase [Ruminococcus sp.]
MKNNDTANDAKLIVISAPSGCGKGTNLARVFEDRDVFYSVSCTTRAPREGEKDGVNYHFLTNERFEEMVKNDEFLEYAGFSDNYYGTPKKPVEENMALGKDAVLEIETKGAFQVKKLREDAVLIFVLPPSIAELDRRLHKRGTEDEETIAKRLSNARGEIEKSVDYDFVIMNDELEDAVRDLETVLESVRAGDGAANRFSPVNEDIKNTIKGVLENA